MIKKMTNTLNPSCAAVGISAESKKVRFFPKIFQRLEGYFLSEQQSSLVY